MTESDNRTGTSQKKVLLLNGPNLNMLGRRDPRQYGTFTLQTVEELTQKTARRFGIAVDCFQTNHEGCLIERIHDAIGHYAGILINAGAWTHTSYALRDAIELTALPAIEVHISDIYKREPFRRVSVIHDVCISQVVGLGLDSYRVATEQLCRHLGGTEHV